MKRDFLAMNMPAEAQVRRALAEYNAARYRVREINRDEPHDDEHSEIREGFERLAQEAVRAELKARDKLSNAVASFAGKCLVPSSLIRQGVARSSRCRENQTG